MRAIQKAILGPWITFKQIIDKMTKEEENQYIEVGKLLKEIGRRVEKKYKKYKKYGNEL